MSFDVYLLMPNKPFTASPDWDWMVYFNGCAYIYSYFLSILSKLMFVEQ